MEQMNANATSEIEKAKQLRMEADLLEQKGKVKEKLIKLQNISEDPYFDQYLGQMLKDLENGKATPQQINREADRSYQKYQQRMYDQRMEKFRQNQSDQQNLQSQVKLEPAKKTNAEFKFGAHVFSIVGGLFVLTAFIIFSFNFMNGTAQGVCLYASACIVVLLSELLLRKRIPAFSLVLTGIGVGGLYAANIANYLVLHTINSLVAMLITVVIGGITIFISKKDDSTTIRLISIIGFYCCLYPLAGDAVNSYEFIVLAAMLLVINSIGVLFQNKKNKLVINIFQLILHIVFTCYFLLMAEDADMISEYLILFTTLSFVFVEILSITQCKVKNNAIFVFCTITSGIYLSLFFYICATSEWFVDYSPVNVYLHILSEVVIIAVCLITFFLWKKEDGRKWAQFYYMAGIMLLGTFSGYDLEIIITNLILFVAVKAFSHKKELITLDCIITFWVGIVIMFIYIPNIVWEIVIILLLTLSLLLSKWMHKYKEIIITLTIVGMLYENNFIHEWRSPLIAMLILGLFFFCNLIPNLQTKSQKAYNIFCLCLMAVVDIQVYELRNPLISTIMTVIGVVMIIIVFRKRFNMAMKRKYLLISGYLIYSILTAHYESTILVSILLMIIALSCVGVGFKVKDKADRICGLVMASLVCLKLVIYDFREADTIYKVIVFLVVGIIALIISFIYILLEKNQAKTAEATEVKMVEENQVNLP